MKNMKCYQPRTARTPSAVAICIRRATEVSDDLRTFLETIDPGVLPEGSHAEALEALQALVEKVTSLASEAPKKRVSVTQEAPSTGRRVVWLEKPISEAQAQYDDLEREAIMAEAAQ
ncbi:MAG: hypothetical protein EBT03_12945 [Betaproteobacteria bacterium]|nr:hypothetical protein [Betaproteobacteria bacterium]